MKEAEKEVIEFDDLKHETDGAYLIVVDEEEHWMPKSLCEIAGDNEIEAPVWLLEKKGLV